MSYYYNRIDCGKCGQTQLLQVGDATTFRSERWPCPCEKEAERHPDPAFEQSPGFIVDK